MCAHDGRTVRKPGAGRRRNGHHGFLVTELGLYERREG
jgi:hypothetical protein